MIRSALLTIATVLVVTMALCSKGPAASQPAPSIDCETVRANYAQWKWVGRPTIRGYLRLQGYSKEDIREAEKCLK